MEEEICGDEQMDGKTKIPPRRFNERTGSCSAHETMQTYEYKIFQQLADVEFYIQEQEIAQTTKFILNRICKNFGAAHIGKRMSTVVLKDTNMNIVT